MRPRVAAALLSFLNGKESGESNRVLNPSSTHANGRHAKRLLSTAREQVAKSLGSGTDPDQIVFTSSGTEANQLAIRSVLESHLIRGKKPHWITTLTEHDSVLRMADWLRARGGEVSFLPADAEGIYRFSSILELWRPETALVSLLWVNNETGVINDPGAAAHIISRLGGILHLDAAQAWGKLCLDINRIGAQLVSFSGPKIGALGGTGVLWSAPGFGVEPVILGKQEKGRRGGTENVLGAISLGAAALELDPVHWTDRIAPLRERLQNAICEKIPGVTVNGGSVSRVANTLNISFSRLKGDGIVGALDLAGYSVSRGAACSSGIAGPSHVLQAMGRSREEAETSVRISLSEDNSWEELERFVDVLAGIVTRQYHLRKTDSARGQGSERFL